MAWLSLFTLLSVALPVFASGPDAEIDNFLSGAFKEEPEIHHVWLTGGLRHVVHDMLHHDYPLARVKYWRIGQRTAWVLDELGKERPITVGIVIDHDKVEKVNVLIYRESRGWEVKSPSFTRQFDGARIGEDMRLDRDIDGISGATLSVRALQRLTQLALLLHQTVKAGEQP